MRLTRGGGVRRLGHLLDNVQAVNAGVGIGVGGGRKRTKRKWEGISIEKKKTKEFSKNQKCNCDRPRIISMPCGFSRRTNTKFNSKSYSDW